MCHERRWPIVVVSVGAVTPFGRRLRVTLDSDPVLDRDRDGRAARRFRRSWESVFYPAFDAWWKALPQAVGRATVERVHRDSVYTGGTSYCTLRTVEGAPRPLELLFDAINAGTREHEAPPHPPADEWPAVTEARRAERLAPPRRYRPAPQGEAVVCEVCGFGYENAGGDKLRHRAYHGRAVNGVRVPRAVQRTLRHVAPPGPSLAEATADGTVCDGVLVVSPTSPVALRRLAYGLSLLLKREQGYDFPAVPYPRRRRWDGAEDEDRTRYQAAYLVALRPARGEPGEPGAPGAPPGPKERAVGLLVLRRRPHGGWWDADARTHTPAPAGVEGWAIEVVYVAPAWRRRGIGAQLTEAAARLHGVRPSELLHSMPLSDGGLALACATAGTRTLPVAG